MVTRQALILVGGRGTRLGVLAAATPKPLMPLDSNRVFLDDVLFHVARHGFDDIVLLAGHLHEQVSARYANRTIHGAQIRVIVEPAPLGTGGALLNAKHALSESFLFLNGDTLFDINFRELDRQLMRDDGAIGALALRRVPDVARYGRVRLEGTIVAAFEEKAPSPTGPAESGLINGGVAVFRRELLARIAATPCSIETDIYPRLVEDGVLRGAEFAGYFIDIGLPDTLDQSRREMPARRRRPAIFFDRDGVLNKDAGYTHRVEDLDWVDGAIESIRAANDAGALVFVVTNQAGVARGYYGTADIDGFHDSMRRDLAKAGAHIDAFYVCPYHPLATVDAYRHPDHPDRKPNPGMILRALDEWPVVEARCALIGDQQTDLEAARRAGIRGLLFEGGDLRPVAADAMSAIGCGPLFETAERAGAGL